MNRKTILITIIFITIIAILLTGCKQKIEEKITEKVIESATGADVDIDKDNAVITTPEGTTQMGSNIEWPKDKMGDLKELKANITMFTEDKENTYSYIMFEGLDKSDAEKYLESIKELGYNSVYEITSADGFTYIGKNEDGYEVSFFYSNDGIGNISYTKSGTSDVSVDSNIPDQAPGDALPEEVDMTDDVPWPKDFFTEIPELEGKITGVSSSGETQKDVYIEYVEKDVAVDYIEEIKEAGFVEDASESMSGDYIEYSAYNSDGDQIIFTWNSGGYATVYLSKSE